jgi:four helix bundle protein
VTTNSWWHSGVKEGPKVWPTDLETTGDHAMAQKILSHRDLQVYQRAFTAAMDIFELSKTFPKEETYSLTDQIRRSSRSVCANLAEARRKRQYEAAFISKLYDSASEAAETEVWLEFAVACQYLDCNKAEALYHAYDGVLRTLVGMITHPETWVIGGESR